MNLSHDIKLIVPNQVRPDEGKDPLVGLNSLAQRRPSSSSSLETRVQLDCAFKGTSQSFFQAGHGFIWVMELSEVERHHLPRVSSQPPAQPKEDLLEAAEALVEAVARVLPVPRLKAVAVKVALAKKK